MNDQSRAGLHKVTRKLMFREASALQITWYPFPWSYISFPYPFTMSGLKLTVIFLVCSTKGPIFPKFSHPIIAIVPENLPSGVRIIPRMIGDKTIGGSEVACWDTRVLSHSSQYDIFGIFDEIKRIKDSRVLAQDGWSCNHPWISIAETESYCKYGGSALDFKLTFICMR